MDEGGLMGERKQYWPAPENDWSGQQHVGFELEGRSELAYRLVSQWGLVAGEQAKEDSSGRAGIRLQTPEELIERAFRVVDLYFEKAIERGELREWVKPEKPEKKEKKKED